MDFLKVFFNGEVLRGEEEEGGLKLFFFKVGCFEGEEEEGGEGVKREVGLNKAGLFLKREEG